MKEPLQILAFSIFSICNQNGISLETQWIPRDENSKAHCFSKMIDHEDCVENKHDVQELEL